MILKDESHSYKVVNEAHIWKVRQQDRAGRCLHFLLSQLKLENRVSDSGIGDYVLLV
jgi:hypothetical protein